MPPDERNEVYINQNQMQGFIDSINNLNSAISRITGDSVPPRSPIGEYTGEEEPGVDAARIKVERRYDERKRINDFINMRIDQKTKRLEELFGQTIEAQGKKINTKTAAK